MRKALLFLVLLLGAVSCGDSFHSSIPDVTKFTYQVDLLQANFQSIRNQGQFVSKTLNEHNVKLGFGGLIIGNSYYSGYCAYDAACPVEASSNVVVALTADGLGKAVCPKCKTVYDLNNYGAPNGVGTEYLKHYYITVVNEDKLYVSN
ncbi:hypothetical protein [uncultured Bacteroides sp.]|uniref:hypothetical protein n=1 Tax=uncultured Bacteroides sp. TaxID=162156 RepID=UPI002AAA8342|nr:hypothetical protein [uncultured Bacteroides sp.]